MLWLGWGLVLLLVKCTWYKLRYMRVECLLFVFPLDQDSKKKLAFPLHRDLTIFLERGDEVVDMHTA